MVTPAPLDPITAQWLMNLASERAEWLQELSANGFEEWVLARASAFVPGTQDVKVVVCLYCESVVRNCQKHREKCSK